VRDGKGRLGPARAIAGREAVGLGDTLFDEAVKVNCLELFDEIVEAEHSEGLAVVVEPEIHSVRAVEIYPADCVAGFNVQVLDVLAAAYAGGDGGRFRLLADTDSGGLALM
jgi:hypothetical protein